MKLQVNMIRLHALEIDANQMKSLERMDSVKNALMVGMVISLQITLLVTSRTAQQDRELMMKDIVETVPIIWFTARINSNAN